MTWQQQQHVRRRREAAPVVSPLLATKTNSEGTTGFFFLLVTVTVVPRAAGVNHRDRPTDLLPPFLFLDETNNEVYAFSKLKKFLLYLNFMMQDTMRYLIEA